MEAMMGLTEEPEAATQGDGQKLPPTNDVSAAADDGGHLSQERLLQIAEKGFEPQFTPNDQERDHIEGCTLFCGRELHRLMTRGAEGAPKSAGKLIVRVTD